MLTEGATHEVMEDTGMESIAVDPWVFAEALVTPMNNNSSYKNSYDGNK